MLRHTYDTPTIKTNALHLVYNEGRKMSFADIYKANTALTWLLLVMHFTIFHPCSTPTFKTKALRLLSNEGRVKHLLLLYKRTIQRLLNLFWL